MGCGYEISKWEHDAVQDSLAGKNTEPDPRILEETMPEVERAIEQRIEEYAQEKIDERIEKGVEREVEVEKELTPEKMDSLFQKEYNEWREEVKDEVLRYKHYDIEPRETGYRLGQLVPISSREEELGIKLHDQRDVAKTIMETFKPRSLTEAKGVFSHEFAEVDYRVISDEERQQLKEIFSTIDKDRELEFFKGELYGAPEGKSNPHCLKDERENYCFWRTAFRLNAKGLESSERMRELKEINPEKFNFCYKREMDNDIEVINEKLGR